MDLEDGCIKVAIPSTELRMYTGVFSRQYSVTFTQVYQIKVLYHFTAYKLYKRYSQFIDIHQQVTDILDATSNQG